MVEQALEEHAEREAAASPAAVVLSPGSGALMLLRLQQSAGNAAVARLVTRSADGHAARAHSLARCAGGTCTCGGTCRGSHDVEEDELAAFALARAVAGRRVVARQHQPGGPYHPPAGTEMRCTMDDDCSTLSTKINY